MEIISKYNLGYKKLTEHTSYLINKAFIVLINYLSIFFYWNPYKYSLLCTIILLCIIGLDNMQYKEIVTCIIGNFLLYS